MPEEGAEVFINGEKRGLTPLIINQLRSGEHEVRVVKTMYLPNSKKITIAEGQTYNENITLQANFANVTLNAAGDIYINDERKAAGQWKGRLLPGNYKVEVKKASHRPSLATLSLKAGEDKTVPLQAPTPIYGSLDITSTPSAADIYVDGQATGQQTPYLMNKLLIGQHEVEFRKNNYQPYKQTVNVQCV